MRTYTRIYMIGVCTKLTIILAYSGDEPGAGRRDCIYSSFEAYCDPCFSLARYKKLTRALKNLDTINRLMIKQRLFRSL